MSVELVLLTSNQTVSRIGHEDSGFFSPPLCRSRNQCLCAKPGLQSQSGNDFPAAKLKELDTLLASAPDNKGVFAGKLLEFRSSNLELPTTGTIYKDNFYF